MSFLRRTVLAVPAFWVLTLCLAGCSKEPRKDGAFVGCNGSEHIENDEFGFQYLYKSDNWFHSSKTESKYVIYADRNAAMKQAKEKDGCSTIVPGGADEGALNCCCANK